MAKKYLVPIDMNNLEIQNFLVHNLATAPTGTAGKLYYNTVTNKLNYYNGSQWIVLDAPEGITVDSAMSSTSENPVQNKVINTALSGKAPNNHASTATTYGIGSSTNYGHVKLSDATDSTTAAASGGTAATPKAVKDALDQSQSYTDSSVGSISDAVDSLEQTKVDKETGKGLSTNDYTTTEKNKLSGIAEGAEVNVQSDWNVTSTTSDAYIRNKPTLGTASEKNVDGSISSGSASTNLPTSQAVADFVSREIGAADAMRFKGTIGTGGDITSLPTSGVKVGDTYRVITAGTYAGQTCEIGDLIIATATTPTWTVAQTNIDGAITSITGTSPVNVTGSGSSRAIAIPNATITSAGLMSASDKIAVQNAPVCDSLTLVAGNTSIALDGIEPGAIVAYTAWDATTNETCVIDLGINDNDEATFTIAAPYSNNLLIRVAYTYV